MPKRIFLFPGQGSQYVGMGKDLYENFSCVRAVFEEAEEALKIKLKKLCFEGGESDLKLTFNTQPALLTTSYAVFKVLTLETDMCHPALLAGHSLGEYTALVVSGALSFSEAVRLVRIRGKCMQEAVPVGKGAMAALLGADAAQVQALCEEVSQKNSVVSCANFNGAGQVVIAGESQAVKRAIESAPQKGIKRALLLEVSAPFHCELMRPAAEKMKEALETVSFSKIEIPYIANVDAHLYQGEHVPVRELLVNQIPNPVRWEESMQYLEKEGIEEAYEVGPGKVLTGLLRRINKEIKTFNVGTVEDIKNL
ncbi:MAG: [acyl-carrier-protein] S-malonyltransferase [Deltaproteobacteria bacterium GWA2_38_16]|nr:MAG: [acyl-carrier-protein] S-malonyltransferase [Deltaproteobacteria bacterium GWA2_38_16]OGQ02579.1 MAG: [acyl-carrier-protein] S-malonyltransferase [Deltaproteobacteria bacterium RIFCSPHIGHO2_02_FULL_38_15]OGQ60408.1 MAG: [acyl-carrier-protein] S-malonyltransferase [Deltaproteobacteria bacterium RIFCSPLOWO2_12_FULL_38_8]HBQ20965.1 [acyl-carrier-protein] S-malonyltransferase [Deltaproteobacteria bacterium]